MRKLPHSLAPYLFAAIMAFCMTSVVSCVVSWINLGWVDNFVYIWLRSWFVAFCIAYPIVLIIAPFARVLAHLLVNQSDES